MKALKNILLAFVAVGLLAGCSDKSERIGKSYEMTEFNALEVSDTFEVDVIPSDREAVDLVISSDVEKYVVVEKKGSTLYIGVKDSYKAHWYKKICLKASVYFKDMRQVTVSGASKVEIRTAYDAKGQNLGIDLSGASSFDGRVLNVGKLTVDVSGASDLDMNGNGHDMQLDVSGASHGDLDEFVVKDFEGEVSGASNVDLYVTETFSGSASGASNIEVEGRPQVLKVEESGASHIRFK